MAQKTDSALKVQQDALFADNVNRAISEEDLRNHFEDLTDSKMNNDIRNQPDGVAGLDEEGLLDPDQLPEATTEDPGMVTLAEDGGEDEGTVPQANDSRLLPEAHWDDTLHLLDGAMPIDMDDYPSEKLVRLIMRLDDTSVINITGGTPGQCLELVVQTEDNDATLTFGISDITWWGSGAPTIVGDQEEVILIRLVNIEATLSTQTGWYGMVLMPDNMAVLGAEGTEEADEAVPGSDPRLVPEIEEQAGGTILLTGIMSWDVDGAEAKYVLREAQLNASCTLSIANAEEGKIYELRVLLSNNAAVLTMGAGIDWWGSAPTIEGDDDKVAILQFRKLGTITRVNLL